MKGIGLTLSAMICVLKYNKNKFATFLKKTIAIIGTFVILMKDIIDILTK